MSKEPITISDTQFIDSHYSSHSQIDLLNEKAMAAVYDGHSREALELSNESYSMATHINYRAGMGRALWNKGWALCELVQFDEALEILHKAGDIFQEIGDALGISRTLQGIGNVYFSRGQLLESLEEYLNAFSVLELAGRIRSSMGLLGNIAYTYTLLGEYFYSIEYAQKELTLAKAFGFDIHVAKALNSLGSSHFHMGDFTTSLNYYTEGLALAVSKKDSEAESWILGNIASVYLQLDNYTGALDSIMQSVAISEQIKDQRHLGFCYNQISSIYRKMNNSSLALDYAMRALANFSSLADKVGESNVLLNIARIFEQNGDTASTLHYAHKSYTLHHHSSTKEGEAESLLLIAKCHEKQSNYSEALISAKTALRIAESINSHVLLQMSLQQLQVYANLTGDSAAAARYSRQYSSTLKISAKEEQRKNAEKLMLEAQFKKTQLQAEALIASSNTSLSVDFLNRTDSLKKQGVVLATTTLRDTTPKAKIQHPVSVQTFGHFTVRIGNRELTTEDWQRKKARDIFKILLMNHRKSVSAEELIDTLWEDAAGRNLIPTLWNCVTYIRKALEPDIMPRQPSSYIKIVGKNYMLDLSSNSEIDFITFKELIIKGQKQSNLESRTQIYEQAIALYSGDFLTEDSFEEWSSFERETLKELYINTVIEIGNYHFQEGNNAHSIVQAKKILEIDRIHENAYELLFKSLTATGNSTELTKYWAYCQSAYKRELLSQPPKFLAALVRQ